MTFLFICSDVGVIMEGDHNRAERSSEKANSGAPSFGSPTDSAPFGRALLLAAAVAIAVGLPVFLTGAFSEQLRLELGITNRQIGLAVSAAFLAGAILSAPFGRWVDRVGTRRTLLLAVAISATAAGLLSAHAAPVTIVPLLFLAGSGAAVGDASINAYLTHNVDKRRRALAFGVNKAAFPGASAAAGLAVTVAPRPDGWRWAYAAAAAVALLVAVGIATDRTVTDPHRAVESSNDHHRKVTPGLLLVGLAAFLGTSAAIGATTFLVAASIEAGATPDRAGMILAGAGAVAITCRLLLGWLASSSSARANRWVGVLLGFGSVGYLVLWMAPWPLFGLAAPVAVGVASGWIGLLMHSVASTNPDRPGAATGIIEAAAFGGAVTGPAVFGTVATAGSFSVAWLFAAVATAIASSTILLASRHH